MTAAKARGSFVVLLFTVAVVSRGVRGEVYEVALPVTGEYVVRDHQAFEVNFGTRFSEIRDVRFRVEGTMVAPLKGHFAEPPTEPTYGYFRATLDLTMPFIAADGPPAGVTTYPGAEAFDGTGSFVAANPIDWTPLLDGVISGRVSMGNYHLPSMYSVAGGLGTITKASLIVDGTPVPEPGVVGVVVAAVGMLWGRRRGGRRCNRVCSGGMSTSSGKSARPTADACRGQECPTHR